LAFACNEFCNFSTDLREVEKIQMKYPIVIAFLLATPVFATNQYDHLAIRVVNCSNGVSKNLKPPYLGKGITPFNWTASHWDSADTLFVKGSWRIDTKEAIVECRVGRGARRSYAVISIHDPT
jgi:hypothetical protein